MKKILSLSLVVLMLLAAMSVSISAAAATTYKDGDVLYTQDFASDDNLKAAPNYGIYGYYYHSGEQITSWAHENGDLRVNAASKSSQRSTRVLLYDVPDDVDRFSVCLEFKLHDIVASTSAGPGLIIADNGLHDTTNSDDATPLFSMIWCRLAGRAQSGAYTYGDKSMNVVSYNYDGIVEAGSEYNVRVYVDVKNNEGVFRITNETLNLVYEEYYFFYNPNAVNTMVGVFMNGSDVTYENLAVYYGDGVFDGAYAAGAETTAPETTAPETPEATDAPPATDKTTEAPDNDDKATEAPDNDDDKTVTTPDDDDGGVNIGLIIGIVAAVVVVAVVVVVVLKKKKK